MKNFTSLVFALLLLACYSNQVLAQQSAADQAKIEESEVKKWIRQHPEVKLIKLSDFLHAKQGERNELLALSKRFVYEGNQPSWADIEAFEASGQQEARLNLTNLNNEMLQVQLWIDNNPHVKIISVEDFMHYHAADKAEFNNLDHKILHDGHLRWVDILAYQGLNPNGQNSSSSN